MTLNFDRGTLVFFGDKLPHGLQRWFSPDSRIKGWRAQASDYAQIILYLRTQRISVTDHARNYQVLSNLKLAKSLTPRPHQKIALQSWGANGYKGVVALPTGAGKTILAIMAINQLQRSSLILVPTIDLLTQWATVLEEFFGIEIGMLGGGAKELRDITVSTYDSALLKIEDIGNRFALLIADECHHLPSPEYRLSAAMAIAPFRLGLSATPELPPERAEIMAQLLGPTVCDIPIDELEGKVLSTYRLERCYVELLPQELAEYTRHREIYTTFLRRFGINFTSSADWGRFLGLCAREPGGKAVFKSFLEQRRIARGGEAKISRLRELLITHAGESIIVFTADNDTAYTIGRRFSLPVITHHTKAAERKEFLNNFRSGIYPVLVTSKVLNEGVDVPAATVGVVVSGSGSVREHVQRLGRILRPAQGKKQAILYELISAGTAEEFTSERRREHRAYRGHGEFR